MISVFDSDSAWKKYKEILFSWKGTPYRHLWMTKGRGCDCTLYIAATLLEAGYLQKVEHDYYPRDWHIHTHDELVMEGFFHHIENNLKPGFDAIQFAPGVELFRGDMVAFSTTEMNVTNHCGIYLDYPKPWMMNSINLRGVSEMQLGNWWMRKLKAVFRVVRK